MSRNGTLDCESFEDRIHQILDDRLTLTGDDLLMSHVAVCSECKKILNDYDSVDDSIKLLPAELAELLTLADAAPSGPLTSRTLILAAVLAASVVISLNVFHSFNATPSNQVSGRAIVSPGPLAIASPNSFAQSVVAKPKHLTPDSSPFSPNFSMAYSMPSIPVVPTWNDISKRLDPLEPALIDPVLSYSTRIPAVRPVHCSFNVTIGLIKKSFAKTEEQEKPDLGLSIDPSLMAAV